MRVLHISPTDTDGGAAKGAYKLHRALLAAGADSLMLVQRKYSDDPSVLTHRSVEGGIVNGVIYEGVRDRLDRLPLRFYDWRRQNWWTVGWLPLDIRSTIDRLKPDVVQLHWAGRGSAPIKLLSRLRAYPIIWTLRDMWPLTGGCHYSGGCEKFLTGCGACPQLGSKAGFDISRWQWRRKYRAWKGVPITYVALSNWMAEYARRSPLTLDNEITVIPNGVEIERYAPIDKSFARSVWHLPTDKRIVMFGALNSTTDPRKGFAYLRKALRILARKGWADHALAVVFGANAGDPKIGMEVRYVGHLHDDISLALLYACADVMVVPSEEENFGKIAVEAMACGVPVTAFANTGQFDIVDHRINGYLAKNLSVTDLARGIAWCLEEGAKDQGLMHRARDKVARCFDIRDIADRYLTLYGQLIKQREQTKDAVFGDERMESPPCANAALPLTMEKAPANSRQKIAL